MRPARLMRRYLVLLLLVTAAGAALLAQPHSTNRDPRDVQYFGARHIWQCAFDSLSAATGCGLLTYRIDQDYTPQGRWTLLAIGVAGFGLFVTTIASAARRAPGMPANLRPPSALSVLGYFLLLLLVVLIPSAWPIEQAANKDANLAEATWRTVSLACGLGWVGDLPSRGVRLFAAAIGGVALLGWWPMLLVPRLRERGVGWGRALRPLLRMTLVLACWLGLLFVFDLPRGQRVMHDGESAWQRVQERGSVVATEGLGAIGVGLPGEAPKPTQLPDGSKLLLALAILVGGLGVGGAGGIGLLFVGWALSGIGRGLLGWPKAGPSERERRSQIATGAVIGYFASAMVVAVGLLLIEWLTAARFQEQPSLADALLESASMLGGAAVSCGLTGTVTDRNLVSGIQLPIDLYQVGMAWLMLAMLAGRLIPIAAWSRLANPPPPPPPPANPMG